MSVRLCAVLQGRKAYDDALRQGAVTEDVPDEFVPGEGLLWLCVGSADVCNSAPQLGPLRWACLQCTASLLH